MDFLRRSNSGCISQTVRLCSFGKRCGTGQSENISVLRSYVAGAGYASGRRNWESDCIAVAG